MGNIINKSNHPVEVKRIDVQVWKLRDEIEAAIAQRVKETEDISQVQIDDIKEFYNNLGQPKEDDLGDLDDLDSDEDDSNLDSSGNPLDDDAMAMMAAMGGGDEGEDSEESSEEEPQESEESPEEEKEENEDNSDDSSDESTDNLEDDDEAAMLAAQMLADQGLGGDMEGMDEAFPEEEEDKPFQRVKPDKTILTNGFSFLSDVNMDQILIFTRDGFTLGQNIIIEFRIPNTFKISAEVIQAKHFARNSNIISDTKPGFRILCRINYLFENERSALRSFLESVEPEIPPPPKKIRKPEEDEEDDDDDFDDLGL